MGVWGITANAGGVALERQNLDHISKKNTGLPSREEGRTFRQGEQKEDDVREKLKSSGTTGLHGCAGCCLGGRWHREQAGLV